MFKLTLSQKNVTIISVTVAALGILSEYFNGATGVISGISALVSPLSLALFSIRNSFYSGATFSINIFDTIFYLLLLWGAIRFSISKGNNVILIRFVFGTIFLNKIIFTCYSFFNALFTGFHPLGYNSFTFFLIYFIVRLMWIWLAYQVIIFLNGQKELETETSVHGEFTSVMYINASTGKRFLNALADYLLIILQFSLLTEMLTQNFFLQGIINKLTMAIGYRLFILLYSIVCRIVYYVIFEFFIGATPAKMLTETRVITEEGQKPDLKTILVRTVSRFVPFESFSFFTGERGWHDKWSGTSVVNEKEI